MAKRYKTFRNYLGSAELNCGSDFTSEVSWKPSFLHAYNVKM
jgi:hypothetical protein